MFVNNIPRTWKYALPATLVILLIPVIGMMLASVDETTQYWALVPCGFAALCLVIAAVNLWKYITAHQEEMFAQHQSALSVTPLVLLSENLKSMHPEAVRVLNRFGVRTSWQVRVSIADGSRDWVLADSNVHFGFIEHVLTRSGTALYPLNRFSQGSKKWDPDGLVEDREQYRELENWMFARFMVTRSHGDFKPAEFIPPWTPELILEAMGLTGDQDLYRPEEVPSAKFQVPGATNAEEKVIQEKKRKEEKPQRIEKEISDEEWEAIQTELREHGKKFADGKVSN